MQAPCLACASILVADLQRRVGPVADASDPGSLALPWRADAASPLVLVGMGGEPVCEVKVPDELTVFASYGRVLAGLLLRPRLEALEDRLAARGGEHD